MTLAIWPETLPQSFLASGYGDAAPDNLITDQYNVGPPAYRRRTTAGPAPYMGQMFMTTAEWEALSTFFHGTLFDGVMRFQFPPQGTIDEAHFCISRFVAPPMRNASDADDAWLVSLALERLALGDAFLTPSRFRDTDVMYATIVTLPTPVGAELETEAGEQILTEAGEVVEIESVVVETEGGSPLETEAGEDVQIE